MITISMSKDAAMSVMKALNLEVETIKADAEECDADGSLNAERRTIEEVVKNIEQEINNLER